MSRRHSAERISFHPTSPSRSRSGLSDDGDRQRDRVDNNDENDLSKTVEEEEEEKRRAEELESSKNELFGDRRKYEKKKKKKANDSYGDGKDDDIGNNIDVDVANDDNEDEEEELNTDDLMNFDLGELDITTVDIPIDFEEVDGIHKIQDKKNLVKFQEDPLVKEALQKGVDLRLYSHQLDNDLTGTSHSLLLSYLSHAAELSVLYNQLQLCNNILTKMESTVGEFQSDLGVVSDEIADLQIKSLSMSTKVNNRKNAGRRLNQFVKSVYIPDETQQLLLEGDITQSTAFAAALEILDSHVHYLQNTTALQSARALEEVIPMVDRIKKSTINRIRGFLADRFQGFARPTTVISSHHQSLLPYSPYYIFLLHTDDKRAESAADELRSLYADTMSRIYTGRFKKYFGDSKKVMITESGTTGMDKGDLMGVEENKTGGLFGKKKNVHDISKYFILGDRDQILVQEAKIIPTTLEKGMNKLPFEQIFKSALSLLCESSVGEYDFVVGFFGEKEKIRVEHAPPHIQDNEEEESEKKSNINSGTPEKPSPSSSTSSSSSFYSTTLQSQNSASNLKLDTTTSSTDSPLTSPTNAEVDEKQAKEKARQKRAKDRERLERGREGIIKNSKDKQVFTNVYSKTVSLFTETLEGWMANTYDALTVLIVIRIISKDADSLRNQNIYFLDSLFDRMTLTLWPKFKHIFDAHLDSITKLPHAIPSAPAQSKGGRGSVSMVSTDPTVHFVCQRYAEFAAGIIRLNRNYNDEILTSNLKRMRTELEKLLNRTATRLSNPRAQTIYLIQQYHYILRVLQSTGVESEDMTAFTALAATQITNYVDEELNDKFKQLIPFIKQHSELLENNVNVSSGEERIDFNSLDSLVKQFSKYWKDGIESLQQSVFKSFGGSPNIGASEEGISSEILKQVLVQFILYYQKFEQIMKRYARGKTNIIKDVIPTSNVMFEIKKYSKIN